MREPNNTNSDTEFTIIRGSDLKNNDTKVLNMLMKFMAAIIVQNGGQINLTQENLSLAHNMAFEIRQNTDNLDMEFIIRNHPDLENQPCQ